MNLKEEPILVANGVRILVTAITWLAAKYVPWFHMTDDQATSLALFVMTALTAAWAFVTRSKVISTAKVSRVSAAQLGEPEHRGLMAAMSVKP